MLTDTETLQAKVSNLARLYMVRYQEAYTLYNTDQHHECVAQLEPMAMDPHLLLFFWLQLHGTLIAAVDEPHVAKDYLVEAEKAYWEIMER